MKQFRAKTKLICKTCKHETKSADIKKQETAAKASHRQISKNYETINLICILFFLKSFTATKLNNI